VAVNELASTTQRVEAHEEPVEAAPGAGKAREPLRRKR
jgi:hypothetical protein